MITRAVLQTDRDRWEWFEEPTEIIQVTADPAAVATALERVEVLVEQTGLAAVGFLTYEAAAAYGLAVSAPGPLPMLCFGLFSRVEERPLGPPVYGEGYSAGPWTAGVTEEEYRERIARIRAFLAAGESYQINYTFPLQAPFSGNALDFFRDMCAAQRGSYAAFLDLTDDNGRYSILSASPELFLERQGDRIVSLPMKGTAARGITREADEQALRELRSSPKERAENLMITDMIRNDLGRIAVPGSVHVPQLFSVERYPRVLQMVSRVEARSDAGLAALMRAMFPCASITGAPKHRTMELIRDLERRYRGIYTGTIGVVRPGRRLRFNVAIRTVLLDQDRGRAEFGVGGGIVWDSSAEGEYRECATKAAILGRPDPPVTLLETMRWNPRRGVTLLAGHVRRLQESYRYFFEPYESFEPVEPVGPSQHSRPPGDPGGIDGFRGMIGTAGITAGITTETERPVLRAEQLDRLITEAVSRASPGEEDRDWRVRLLLDDEPRVEVAPLPVSEDILGCRRDDQLPLRRVALARRPIDHRSPWVYHKTTNRGVYQEHLNAHPEADDVLLFNERDYLTESCFASILVERVLPPRTAGDSGAGRFPGHKGSLPEKSSRYLATPPVRDGLLPGVFREYLLKPPSGTEPWTPGMLPVVEESVPLSALEEVLRGDVALYLVNSVRGWMRAELVGPQRPPT